MVQRNIYTEKKSSVIVIIQKQFIEHVVIHIECVENEVCNVIHLEYIEIRSMCYLTII